MLQKIDLVALMNDTDYAYYRGGWYHIKGQCSISPLKSEQHIMSSTEIVTEK